MGNSNVFSWTNINRPIYGVIAVRVSHGELYHWSTDGEFDSGPRDRWTVEGQIEYCLTFCEIVLPFHERKEFEKTLSIMQPKNRLHKKYLALHTEEQMLVRYLNQFPYESLDLLDLKITPTFVGGKERTQKAQGWDFWVEGIRLRCSTNGWREMQPIVFRRCQFWHMKEEVNNYPLRMAERVDYFLLIQNCLKQEVILDDSLQIDKNYYLS